MNKKLAHYDTRAMEFLMKENDRLMENEVALFAKQPDGQPEVTADGYARRSMPLPGDMKTLLLPEGDPDWGVVHLVVPMSFYSPPVKLTRWQRFKKFVQSIIFQWPVTIDRG